MGPRALGSSRPEIGKPAFSFPSSRALQKAFREQKLLRVNLSRLLSLAPGKGGAILPQTKTFENHYNRPLPQKISKNIQIRPNSLI